MITRIRALLVVLGEESLTVEVGPFQLEVLLPDHARRQLQGRVGEWVELHTQLDIEGGQMGGRLWPRLIGFLSPIDREFFDIFCSVDGVGVKKALRAMVRPVRDLARMIQDQDLKMLATLPGIGEATAERIVAKLRRKVGKFALMVATTGHEAASAESNGAPENADADAIRDAFSALLSVGHSESQARHLLDRALSGRKRYKSAADLLLAIYDSEKQG